MSDDPTSKPVTSGTYTTEQLEQRLLEAEAQLVALKGERAQRIAAQGKQLAVFDAMIETVPVGVAISDIEGRILQGNRVLSDMVRHPILHSRDTEDYGEWVSYHADGTRVQSLDYPLARVLREDIDEAELIVHYQRGDKTRFWMRIIGNAVRDTQGKLIGAAVACVDVDEEHRLRDAQDILIAELNHRVKNAFSVTNAIVGRSLRQAGVDNTLRSDIDARLNAYAQAHATLVGTDYRTAPLEDVARMVLDKIALDRIDMQGEHVSLATRAALPFSMAFYELATNATKYGSLSDPDGRVSLSWRKARMDGKTVLHVSWIESGGPTVSMPTEEGFGTFVIGRALMAETQGQVRREFAPDGFEWHFTMPLPDDERTGKENDISRILVVEDEVFVAFEINDILTDLGFEVVGPALNVEDAEKLARTSDVDAAFLDVNLGDGKTSEPVAAALRERDVPFVFISAYTADQITFCTSDDRVLEKPITGNKIVETMRAVLPDLEIKG